MPKKGGWVDTPGFLSTLFVVMPTKFAILFTFANLFAVAR